MSNHAEMLRENFNLRNEVAQLREDKQLLDFLASNGGGFTHDEKQRGICTSAWG